MSQNLFTYGSLMFPEIMRAVSGADYAGRSATLPDHARYQLVGQTYPGLIEEPAARTAGIVYLNLEPLALERLDRFEGDWYLRKTVTLILADDTQLPAETYLLHPSAHAQLTKQPWDPQQFEQAGLRQFVAEYQGFGKI